jgi:hypothetical protein
MSAHLVQLNIDKFRGAGHISSLQEAMERIGYYRLYGASEFAFGWADLPAAKLQQERWCA